MVRHINLSGYVYYDNEPELCKELETLFFPTFFDNGWKPIDGITKEVWLSSISRIDYSGVKNHKKTYVEVKNHFLKTNWMEKQIKQYAMIIGEKQLYLICMGTYKKQQSQLKNLKVKTILIKDIKELNPAELVYWM